MRELIDCDKQRCEYYNKYYDVIPFQGGFTPDFSQVSEYCAHPDKLDLQAKKTEQIGVRLITLNKCPKQDGNN